MTTGYRNRLRRIMQSAWDLARNGARRFGGSPREYIRMALAIVWSDERMAPAAVYTFGLGTRYWLPGVEQKKSLHRGQYMLPGVARSHTAGGKKS